MDMLERILEGLGETGEGVRRVTVGALWTLVETEGGAAGLAMTDLGEGPTHGKHGKSLAGAGNLTRPTVRELAEAVREPCGLARSVGLAALNALAGRDADGEEENAAEWARREGEGRRLGLVGWFPFVEELRAAGREVEIFEKDPATGFALTEERRRRLAACGAVCVTAATLANGTFGGVAECLAADAKKALVGPGSPLSGLWLEEGWDAVYGAKVEDADAVERVVREGGCFRQIRRAGGVRLVVLRKTGGSTT